VPVPCRRDRAELSRLMAEGPRYYACRPEPGVPRLSAGDRTRPAPRLCSGNVIFGK
jgi:hypothetical protein